jgi:hypothetical protein
MVEIYRPTFHEMENLVATARNHPLGTEFLLNGDLCAVAITFGTHVFTVEAVRDHWKELKETKEDVNDGI